METMELQENSNKRKYMGLFGLSYLAQSGSEILLGAFFAGGFLNTQLLRPAQKEGRWDPAEQVDDGWLMPENCQSSVCGLTSQPWDCDSASLSEGSCFFEPQYWKPSQQGLQLQSPQAQLQQHLIVGEARDELIFGLELGLEEESRG